MQTFKKLFIILGYSWFTMLCSFQVYSKVIPLYIYCCSVTKSCLTLCTPCTAAHQASLWAVFQSLLTHVSIESMMPFNYLVLCHPLLHLPSMSCWASASVLSMNIQGWFSLGLTGLISLQSKGLWRVFQSTTIWKHQMVSHLYGPTVTSIRDHWKSYSFDYMDLC